MSNRLTDRRTDTARSETKKCTSGLPTSSCLADLVGRPVSSDFHIDDEIFQVGAISQHRTVPGRRTSSAVHWEKLSPQKEGRFLHVLDILKSLGGAHECDEAQLITNHKPSTKYANKIMTAFCYYVFSCDTCTSAAAWAFKSRLVG